MHAYVQIALRRLPDKSCSTEKRKERKEKPTLAKRPRALRKLNREPWTKLPIPPVIPRLC
eukprot:1156503-Pelagomonas_calceolata.AAC.3